MKLAFLHLCRALGLFRLAGFVHRRRLCILCYHGFALDGESAFRAKLFMEPRTFAERMARLARSGRPVLPLGRAVELLQADRLPPGAVAITLDDGFHSVHRCAAPVLRELGFPATVYVTSHYVTKRTPIFRLFVQLAFWKSKACSLELAHVIPELRGEADLTEAAQRDRVLWRIIDHGEALDTEQQVAIARRLGDALGVPYAEVEARRSLTLMTEEEIVGLREFGIDVQLHTHRHRLPLERAAALGELESNRAVLSPLASAPLVHFCYPSGQWSREHWPFLHEAGIVTATTCDYGLNRATTPRLALHRFLDGEDVTEIEFDAAVCGFTGWLHALRAGARAARALWPASRAPISGMGTRPSA